MSKRVKNRKGRNRKGRNRKGYDKQFYSEGSSSRTANSLPSGAGRGYPWWLFIRFYQDGSVRLPADRLMV